MSSLTEWKVGLREIFRYFCSRNPWLVYIYFLLATFFTLKGYDIGADFDASFALRMHYFAWSFGFLAAFGCFLVGPAVVYLIGKKKRKADA
jgi:hypothetical protein